MPEGVITVGYLIASILFILSLGGLSKQETSRRGNIYGIYGMGIAILATLIGDQVIGVSSYSWLFVLMLLGASVGVFVAKKVEMTSMPELVAILHSFVGAAAVLVGVASYVESEGLYGSERIIHEVEILIGVIVGAITFTGSVIAFGKLKGTISSKPLSLPFRHQLNLIMIITCIVMGGMIMTGNPGAEMDYLLWIIFISAILGIHMILAIGGADMPVVVSMLNSYSGWAASAAGFMLANNLLIITGALVGSSGAILSYIMCRGMNRSFVSVIAGGFGVAEGTVVAPSSEAGEVNSMTHEEVWEQLMEADKVIIVPGYGMAVAQAQHVVQEMTDNLRNKGKQVHFAIHPVAGRLPGHMNVLLAEANLPYDIVFEMEEINPEFGATDVVLVVGANDIVNPRALDDTSSPIYGMPVLEVWNSKTVVVLKRSMATGYSGVDNPLYYGENTFMLFGDAKESMSKLTGMLTI